MSETTETTIHELSQKLDAANAELAASKAREQELLAQSEAAKQDSALREAVAATRNKPASTVTTGQLENQRTRAVAAVGGPAHWFALGLNERLAALGQQPASTEEISEARIIFGGQNSLAASQLRTQNPTRYFRLRVINKEIR